MRKRKWHKPKPIEAPSFYNTTPEPTAYVGVDFSSTESTYAVVLMQEANRIVDSVESEDRLATREEIIRCDEIIKELEGE